MSLTNFAEKEVQLGSQSTWIEKEKSIIKKKRSMITYYCFEKLS